MCWSGEASTVLAAIGFAGTLYAVYKKESPFLWVPLGYFALMEALQAFTYTVINQCALPSNQLATYLGYLHIAFQPFFANAACLFFVPPKVREKIQGLVFTGCFAATIFLLIQLYPFDWAGLCLPGRALCAQNLCSVSGNWHIAWNLPLNGIGNELALANYGGLKHSFLAYELAVFLMPVLYGSWRFTLYHFLMGPLLAFLLTNNPNERPAVWCLLSIGMLLIVVKTPIRKYLYVKNWFWWPRSWR